MRTQAKALRQYLGQVVGNLKKRLRAEGARHVRSRKTWMHYIDNAFAGYSAQPVKSLSTTKAIVTRYSDDTFSHQLRGYQMEIKLMRLGLNTHSHNKQSA